MRIVGIEEFLKLDSPLLFIKCDKFGNPEGGLKVGHGRLSEDYIDFVYVGLNGFAKKEGEEAEEHYDIIESAIHDDTSFEWDYSMSSRDGLHDQDQLYMVYEDRDVLELIKLLQRVYSKEYV